jgi:hypothetical protein
LIECLFSLFQAMGRFHYASQMDETQMLKSFGSVMVDMNDEEESAIAVYQTPKRVFWTPAIAASKLLDRLSPGWRGTVKVAGELGIKVPMHNINAVVSAWAEGMDDVAYGELNAKLGIKWSDDAKPKTRQVGCQGVRHCVVCLMHASRLLWKL